MDFRLRWKSGRVADITAMTEVDPKAAFGSIHYLPALVTDWAMEAWYHPSIA
jgi:hypothetical protein